MDWLMTKNWTDIKRMISSFSRTELTGLVQDLYRASEHNQRFLHTRFLAANNKADLTLYKKKIKAALSPKNWEAPIRYGEARKAISEYKKARGEVVEMVDLMLYYVKCGNDVTLEFGDMDERFYDSMGSMFRSLVDKLKSQDDPDLIAKWLPKLTTEANRVRDVGWGYGDELRNYIEEL